MTLIISAATPDFAIQIADTRLSSNGRSVTDAGVKMTITHSNDAMLSISYTGIARIDGLRTDIWIANLLKDSKCWLISYPEIVELLRNKLSLALESNPHLKIIGLSVSICGLGVNKGKRDVAIASVSNIEEFRKIENGGYFVDVPPNETSFSKIFFNSGKGFKGITIISGAVTSKMKLSTLFKKIDKKLKMCETNEQRIKMRDDFVTLLRLHRDCEHLEEIIGEDCSAVIIDEKFNADITFYKKNLKTKPIPNIVTKDLYGVNLIQKELDK